MQNIQIGEGPKLDKIKSLAKTIVNTGKKGIPSPKSLAKAYAAAVALGVSTSARRLYLMYLRGKNLPERNQRESGRNKNRCLVPTMTSKPGAASRTISKPSKPNSVRAVQGLA